MYEGWDPDQLCIVQQALDAEGNGSQQDHRLVGILLSDKRTAYKEDQASRGGQRRSKSWSYAKRDLKAPPGEDDAREDCYRGCELMNWIKLLMALVYAGVAEALDKSSELG